MRTSLVLVLACAEALAQTPPRLWTKFVSSTSHADVAARACAMDVKAGVAGQYRPIEVRALDDSSVLCETANRSPDAVHATIQMTNDIARRPSEIVVEIEVPPNASPSTIAELREALRYTAAEIERRALTPLPVAAPPPPPPQQTAPTPMHPVTETNWPLIGVGIGGLLIGWGTSAIVGLSISSSTTDPGTPKWWPYVPFVGAIAFSASYRESPSCGCAAGRVFAVLGSALIDGAQVAGLIFLVAGVASPRERMVPNSVGFSLRPNGASLEIRF